VSAYFVASRTAIALGSEICDTKEPRFESLVVFASVGRSSFSGRKIPMLDRFYKLKSRLTGLVFLPSGSTMEVTIPAGSIVNVLCAPVNRTELTSVRYGERSCEVQIDALRKCGISMGSVAA
jgi:hypothetical protein